MLFESSELLSAIKDKSLTTADRTLKVINAGKEDVNAKSRQEETYLHLIAHAFKKDEDAPYLLPVVFQLSNAGIDACAVDRDGNTALHVAAKARGTRRLIRALLMIGVDPTIENNTKQTASQVAKSNLDNSKIIKLFYPGLWQAVTSGSTDTVNILVNNWCKVDYSRDGVNLTHLADGLGNGPISDAIHRQAQTISYAHCALAGDRQRLRPFFQSQDLNKNTVSDMYIDASTGNFVSMPLIGEVALLGLTSVVRKMIRKKCDVTVAVNEKPLALYVLENIVKAHDGFSDMFHVFIDKIDFTQYHRHTVDFLKTAYEKELPLSVMGKMAANGLDLFATDDEGHFLRDLILLKNANLNPAKIAEELKFVDDVIVDIAKRGFVEYLRMLSESFYEHIFVESREGTTTLRALMDSVGPSEADKLTTHVEETQKLYRTLLYIIKIGNFTLFEKTVKKKIAMVKDRHGRTLVHHIVLFEREPMLRFYRKLCRPKFNVEDKDGRTPLFWACAIEEGAEIENMLIAQGCRMDLKDKTGTSPADVKALTRKEKDDLLAEERTRDPGLDTYLFYRYMELKEAVRCGDVVKVEEIRSKMYRDIPMSDLMTRMYQTSPPQRDILAFAVDARRDGIAKCLLTLGMDWDVKYKDDKEEITLLEAAKKRNMKGVEGYINFQMQEQEKQKEAFRKLRNKGVLKENKDSKDINGSKDNKDIK